MNLVCQVDQLLVRQIPPAYGRPPYQGRWGGLCRAPWRSLRQ